MKSETGKPAAEGEAIEGNFEVIHATDALQSITAAEIDVQIATAHKYPRSIQLFTKRAIEMACIDEETAASCLYRKPVGKKDGVMQYAEGLSVRMAEIVMAAYGNFRVACMLIDNGNPRQVKARGMAHDLESNVAASSEVVEATVYGKKPGQKEGDPYNDNMRTLVSKACLSKARRDAVFMVVPKAMARPIETAVRKLLAGDEKSLTRRRNIVLKWLEQIKVEPARMFAAMDIKGEADMTSEILDTLTGLRTAINDKETTIDEAFSPIVREGNVGKPAEDPKGATGTTATEEAAAERKTEPPPPTESGKPPKGPSAEDLRKKIVKKINPKNVGKSRLITELIEMNVVPAGSTFDKLDLATLANIDDMIDDVIERITKPAS